MKRARIKFIAAKFGCLNNTQAEVAGRELERIQAQYGSIKPQYVVDESRPENAVLHEHFTWDDIVAAEKCREDEARNIIRSVRIIDNSIPAAEQPEIRAFVNVSAHDAETKFEGQSYISTEWAEKDEDYRRQVVNKAWQELKLWQRRYADYKEFFGVHREIAKLEKGSLS
jgi:hypothetical protein